VDGLAFEKEMLSGKQTEASVSHSGSDHFSVTRQEVQARQLEVIQEKKRNPVEPKYNCLYCSEVCAEHSPACRDRRRAQSKEADK